jgi:radical SAM superfamily enzyme YgiQ (UPF0313 family)
VNLTTFYFMKRMRTKPGTAKTRILFLQLPRLENGREKEQENLPLAGFYLWQALERRNQNQSYEARFLTPEEEQSDDAELLGIMLDWEPDWICATLYLWNIERTLHLLRRIKKGRPETRIMVGGPEVANPHPFLFKSGVADVAVAGEGEAVFPLILQAWNKGVRPDIENVAIKHSRKYRWGRHPAPVLELREMLPAAEHPGWQPDANRMAYLETVRGCPRRCSYCRYSQMRRNPSWLGAKEVKQRAKVLMARGSRQIRLVDPTFNANPDFRPILKELQRLNRGGRVRFFAELQADLLQAEEIELLAAAGFREVEVGVQSRDPEILQRIGRSADFNRLEQNLKRLSRAGMRVTIDLMYGLPGQRLPEVQKSIQWAGQFKRADVQCLQTLLLPGTALRRQSRKWGYRAELRPPYGVLLNASFSEDDLRRVEEFLNQKWANDSMTSRFVGQSLPDLFKERLQVPLEDSALPQSLPGRTARRALIFRGADLFNHRKKITSSMGRAIRSEPHMLWQFVLQPDKPFPLDLLEDLIREIRRFPKQWMDRFACVAGWDRVASRRIFVLLKKGRIYPAGWCRTAEKLLEDEFY